MLIKEQEIYTYAANGIQDHYEHGVYILITYRGRDRAMVDVCISFDFINNIKQSPLYTNQ